ncbi:MAG: MFS transporter [Bacteroidota bacterium]
MLLPSFGISIVNVALPTLSVELGVPFKQIQWVVISYLIALTSLIVSAGRLADLVGYRRLLLVGISLFTLASFLCGIAFSISVLILFRIIQGIGAAIMLALSLALVSQTVPKERMGSAMGLLGTMSAIGTASGPTLCGLLISWFSWRGIFFFQIPFGVLALVLAVLYLPSDHKRPRNGKSLDWVGTLILVVILTTYSLAVTGNNDQSGFYTYGYLFLAGIGLWVFLRAEKRQKSPLIQLEFFKNKAFSSSLVINVMVMTVMMATLIIGPFYLSQALILKESTIGLIMSIGPAISILSGIPAGRVVDRFGAPSMILVGLSLLTSGALVLAWAPATLGLSGYIFAIAILTPGYQMFQAANNTFVMKDFPTSQAGVISGILNLSRNLGLISGAAVMGAIFARSVDTHEITDAPANAVMGGMQTTFLVASALMVFALGVTMFSRRTISTPVKLEQESNETV